MDSSSPVSVVSSSSSGTTAGVCASASVPSLVSTTVDGDGKKSVLYAKKSKRFICGYCCKRFTLKQNLKVHIRVHTNERPFGCNYCSKRFKDSRARINHHLTHTGDKPHVCDVCLTRFGQKSSYNRHLRSQTHQQKLEKVEEKKTHFLRGRRVFRSNFKWLFFDDECSGFLFLCFLFFLLKIILIYSFFIHFIVFLDYFYIFCVIYGSILLFLCIFFVYIVLLVLQDWDHQMLRHFFNLLMSLSLRYIIKREALLFYLLYYFFGFLFTFCFCEISHLNTCMCSNIVVISV